MLYVIICTGLVGLAISYALSVTGLLSGVVTSFTETEKQMVSVERAMQYIHGVPAEKNTGRAKVGDRMKTTHDANTVEYISRYH